METKSKSMSSGSRLLEDNSWRGDRIHKQFKSVQVKSLGVF